jgi:hypothetical protein
MNTKRIRDAGLWCGLLAIVPSILAVIFPVPPHGRFSTPKVGNEADAYLEFSDGKATSVIFGGDHGREGEESRHVFGQYHRENGRWVLITDGGLTGRLSTTFLSITIVYDQGGKDGPFYRYEIYKGR